MMDWEVGDFIAASAIAFLLLTLVSLLGALVYDGIQTTAFRHDCVKYGMDQKYPASDIVVVCGVRK